MAAKTDCFFLINAHCRVSDVGMPMLCAKKQMLT